MTSAPPPVSTASRRFIAGLIRLGLVVAAVVIVAAYVKHHYFRRMTARRHVSVETQAPPVEALGPGDVRIYNTDSTVDVLLQGNRLMTGLSAKTVAKVKEEMSKDADRDSGSGSAFGVNIGQIVKQTVAGAIGTHVVYQIRDIRDITYDDGQLRVEWMDGRDNELFGSTRVNGEKTSNTFRPDEAQRLIDAFHARKGTR